MGSLPAPTGFRAKVCATAVDDVLDQTLAPSSRAGEMPSAVLVAAADGRFTVPFSVLGPFTSSVVAGVAVPIPTFVPDSVITELPSVDEPVHTGTAPVVPVPVIVGLVSGFACTVAACKPVARRYAEAGSPPRVWALVASSA